MTTNSHGLLPSRCRSSTYLAQAVLGLDHTLMMSRSSNLGSCEGEGQLRPGASISSSGPPDQCQHETRFFCASSTGPPTSARLKKRPQGCISVTTGHISPAPAWGVLLVCKQHWALTALPDRSKDHMPDWSFQDSVRDLCNTCSSVCRWPRLQSEEFFVHVHV